MSKSFLVGEYLIEPDLNRVSDQETEERIEPRAMEVLVYLAEHAGEVIGKERLIRAVWQDTFVADGALWQCISRLREVFGDDVQAPAYIQTIPRKGYVLIATVSAPEGPDQRYKIVKKLGAGAMGEVFLAEDQILRRKVALKFIVEEKQEDEQYRRRLLREARSAAALDHPFICKTFTVGKRDGKDFIAMEHISGTTLQHKLESGPLSLEEFLRLTTEMTEALEAAHEQGVVHRDFKPANVMLDGQGHVKLMDFGLARRLPTEDGVASADETISALTQDDQVVGTLAYMSPEQLRGASVDGRSDIFSLGAVAYEMLTGVHPFRRAEAMETVGAVLKDEPEPLARFRPDAPELLTHIVRKMLAKDPANRYQLVHDIHTDLVELERGAGSQPLLEAIRPEARGAAGIRSSSLAVVCLLGILVGAFGFRSLFTVETDPPPLQFELASDTNRLLTDQFRNHMALSPDGRRLVFRESLAGPLYVRNLGDRGKVPLRDSEGGTQPFFSSDGQWVAFFANGKLKKVPLSGGSAEILCEARYPFGGTWGPDGTIVFGRGIGFLWRVPESGGTPRKLAELNRSKGERSHSNPSFLPDGSGILFSVWYGQRASSLALLDLDSGEYKELLTGVTRGVYVPGGHLVYTRAAGLYGVPFDLKTQTITGSEVPLVQDILVTLDNLGHFAISGGTLAYIPGTLRPTELVLVGLDGEVKETLPTPTGIYAYPRISPDGRRIVFEERQPGRTSLRILDRRSGRLTPLRTAGSSMFPFWTPGGERVTYLSDREGAGQARTYSELADGSGSADVLVDPEALGFSDFRPHAWSRDGRFLVGVLQKSASQRETTVGYLDRQKPETLTELLPPTASGLRQAPHLSPQGDWLAYTEFEPGEPGQVWVSPFPQGGSRLKVSRQNGKNPRWSPDGGQLYYESVRPERKTLLLMVEIQPATQDFSEPRAVLEFGPGSRLRTGDFESPNWSLSPDGQFLVMVRYVDETQWTPPTHFNINTGFFQKLREKVPSEN